MSITWQVGDVLEGTGRHRVRIRVESIDGPEATVTLVRTGKKKRIGLSTLRAAYRRVEAKP